MTEPVPPVASFNVSSPTSTTTYVVVAETFCVQPNGCVVFYRPNGQTVAAFADKEWERVQPVATP